MCNKKQKIDFLVERDKQVRESIFRGLEEEDEAVTFVLEFCPLTYLFIK